MSDLWHVLLADPQGAETPVLSELAQAFFRMTPFDAHQRARRMWGWLGERLSKPEAEALRALAESRGVPSRLLADEETVPFPRFWPPHGGGPAGEGLVFHVGAPAVEKRVPFSDIRLLTFMGLREEQVNTVTVKEGPSLGEKAAKLGLFMATGIPLGFGGGKEEKKTVRTGEFVMALDVFTPTEAYRIFPDRFGFSGLSGPGSWTGLENARRFLAEVSARAPMALLNRGARVVLDKKPLNTLGYDERHAYDKECLWLLQLTSDRPV